MRVLQVLLGRPLLSTQAAEEQIGSLRGVPVLGLDALASAAYGPEALLTVLLPLGAMAAREAWPLIIAIVGILLLVQCSYRQTIAAYPQGGGSFTVASANLGLLPGLLAGTALCLDYMLNVAVAIAAGVAALCSALPALLPETLPLCLVILLLLCLVNLRGIRASGGIFLIPTCAFVVLLLACIGLGGWHALRHEGPAVHAATHPAATGSVSWWLLLRAFASGCTAMTGIEAVSNAVPLFRAPAVTRARRCLALIVLILVVLLVGEMALCRALHLSATTPGAPGYESILSQLAHAVWGRGLWYGLTIASVITVLILSANTSFAGFPRLCQSLAQEEFLPEGFAQLGRRLVYSHGILLLTAFAGVLLILFGGVTDRLIPLFAIGALLAFTMSQLGMIVHWHRSRQPGARRSLAINALGFLATFLTLLIVLVSKFVEGAWISVMVIALLLAVFLAIRRHYRQVEERITLSGPLHLQRLAAPIAVVPLRRLGRVETTALNFAFAITSEVHAVHIRTQARSDELRGQWRARVLEPARAQQLPEPKLVEIDSPARALSDPLLRYVHELTRSHPNRQIAVVIPELIDPSWFHYLLHGHTATLLKLLLLFRGGPRVAVVTPPFYSRPPAEDDPRTDAALPGGFPAPSASRRASAGMAAEGGAN